MSKQHVAGLTTQIDLSFPLVQSIIPVGQVLQRPGITRGVPGYWVQHETDNHSPGMGAAAHATYMHNGCPDENGQPQAASWHFTVDDHGAYQHIPVDEVTWNAADGSGPGNESGISCELAVNSDGNKTRSRANAEELCAAICHATGLGSDRVKRHWDFNAGNLPSRRHHCPDEMMNENYWPTFVANVAHRLASFSSVDPSPIWWQEGEVGPKTRKTDGAVAFALLGQVTAKRHVPIHKDADDTSPIVARMNEGQTATIVGTHKNSRSWVFVEVADGQYGRGLMSAFDPPWPTIPGGS